MKKRILIVDDERDILDLVQFQLEKAGFDVITAIDGEIGYRMVQADHPDLIVLDWMVPKLDGIEVCKLIRQDAKAKTLPILMLSAKSEEFDKVFALEIGADDYLSKPFSPRELVARVKALLRRQGMTSEPAEARSDRLDYEDLLIDVDQYDVRYKGELLPLTKTEFELLYVMAKVPQRVFTREQLLFKVWGQDFYGDARVVDVHIRRLRSKLEAITSFEYVRTVRGVGYKFAVT